MNESSAWEDHTGTACSGATEHMEQLAHRYRKIRALTEDLCEPLEPEDYVLQSMADASPTRWHLAHVTWFFETFVLRRYLPGYRVLNETYNYLFNSYYNSVGTQWPRPRRGLLSRPTVEAVYEYRAHVDRHMLQLLETVDRERAESVSVAVSLGFNHEQQHQELILTDIKHALAQNPLYPTYRDAPSNPASQPRSFDWVRFDEGLYRIGHAGDVFCYDNETPRHRVFLEAFQLASRPVTNAEYLRFIEDGGYGRPELWLSDAWMELQNSGWVAPLYWWASDGGWRIFTLRGLRDIDPEEPVSHISYYEADAFARWAGARLPTEAEWEVASTDIPLTGNFVESGRFHPSPESDVHGSLTQMFGNVWEWTASPYTPYPGYEQPEGAFGEYNGKFMCDQMVLRGGSCATSVSHIRSTYRNFFQAPARWQFSGIRLAKDA